MGKAGAAHRVILLPALMRKKARKTLFAAACKPFEAIGFAGCPDWKLHKM